MHVYEGRLRAAATRRIVTQESEKWSGATACVPKAWMNRPHLIAQRHLDGRIFYYLDGYSAHEIGEDTGIFDQYFRLEDKKGPWQAVHHCPMMHRERKFKQYSPATFSTLLSNWTTDKWKFEVLYHFDYNTKSFPMQRCVVMLQGVP